MFRTSERLLDLLIALFLGVIAGCYAYQPLRDVDLGWHLVGGLSMLEFHSLPGVDFLGDSGSAWWCYSWLSEIAIALLFQAGGFPLLQFAQVLAAALLPTFCLWWVRQIQGSGGRGAFRFQIYRLLATTLLLIFFVPVLYLRPQLLSFVLFLVAVSWVYRQYLSLPWWFVLTLLWANVHVYWILAPALLVLFGLAEVVTSRARARVGRWVAASVTAFFGGCCTPYGLSAFEGLWRYAFEHHVAYQIIREFQPLLEGGGVYLWLIAALLVVVIGFSRRILSRARPVTVLLFLILTGLALSRVKYVPFFGVGIALLFLEAVPSVPPIAELATRHQPMPRRGGWRRPCIAALEGLLFIVVLLSGLRFQSALTPEWRELLQIGSELQGNGVSVQQGPVHVLAPFDDGGWLALAFWLSRPDHSLPSNYRTQIDGRTLVMGEKRLAEYAALRAGGERACAVLQSWKPDIVVIPRDAVQFPTRDWQQCAASWKAFNDYRFWSVFTRS